MEGYQPLPDIGMSDPNNMQAPNQSAGGKTKINKTDMSGADSRDQHINGDKVSYNGFAPGGENSSGIPAAQPIDPLTFGDPNGTSVDFNDGPDASFSEVADKEVSRHGFTSDNS